MNGKIIDKVKFPSPNPRIELSVVTYLSNNLKVKGLLAVPKGKGKFEAILYLRGGIKSVGMVRVGRIIQFASEGFVVMAPFYRGNQGGEGNEDFAGDDRYDAISAIELLREHPMVQQERIHLFGFSRGGVMALIAGIMSKHIRSVVTWGGVSDMVLTYIEREDLRRMMKRVIGGTPTKFPKRYKWRTPLYELGKMNAPVLIIHGVKDKNVSVEHAYRLEKRLKELDKKVETWYFDEFTHYFPPSINRETLHRLCLWMKKQ
ncbi:alpha/beta hydrolase family protein [Metabacillus niabensis]|uniref:Dipeptidyl aminopeptidase/acylaminoacyl peptidase n=1 Tax=Metabacillus niabensis TaxID=324854 RepID=A0ABT9YWY1_9BACI|nr:prolyl oligopeptidase family serine peptidase [Metabacillus niabensis]MDQ0224503.1 dipeptidyl aminopeptidase/acylaminoacyl peptidase [Metabacillus niabensis]